MEETGCWQEARRCDGVALKLLLIRRELPEDDRFADITQLVDLVEATSRLLRDLHDLFCLYRERIRVVVYYLALVLPCLQKTLTDMLIYIGHPELPPARQWALMNNRMGDQGNITLAERFVL
jgi:hypothetical protein